MSRFRIAAVMVALASSACVGGPTTSNYGRSVNGTTGYSMLNVHAKPPSLLVARKVERPLYLVVDSARVKDRWTLSTAPCATSSPGCEHAELTEFQEFVRRDLKAALASYFTTVEVVDSIASLPETPYAVADVKIDDIRLDAQVRGMLTYEIIEMTWSFALRTSEQQDYAFSFAGTSRSNDSYPTFEAGCGQLVENAVAGMLQKWTEAGGPSALAR